MGASENDLRRPCLAVEDHFQVLARHSVGGVALSRHAMTLAEGQPSTSKDVETLPVDILTLSLKPL